MHEGTLRGKICGGYLFIGDFGNTYSVHWAERRNSSFKRAIDGVKMMCLVTFNFGGGRRRWSVQKICHDACSIPGSQEVYDPTFFEKAPFLNPAEHIQPSCEISHECT